MRSIYFNKKFYNTFVLLASSVMLASCAERPFNEVLVDNEALVNKDVLIVDVRTEAEFNAGYHPLAINIPYTEILQHLDILGPKDTAIILYCRTGRRSAIARDILKEKGYTNITAVENQYSIP